MTPSDEPSVLPPQILVVEDDPAVRELLKRFLDRKGWTAIVAPDPEEALSVLKARPVTHALVDLHLDTDSGVDLIRKMRDQWPDLHIVAMTATLQAEGKDALAAGAETVLPKPFPSLNAVRACIEDTNHRG